MSWLSFGAGVLLGALIATYFLARWFVGWAEPLLKDAQEALAELEQAEERRKLLTRARLTPSAQRFKL